MMASDMEKDFAALRAIVDAGAPREVSMAFDDIELMHRIAAVGDNLDEFYDTYNRHERRAEISFFKAHGANPAFLPALKEFLNYMNEKLPVTLAKRPTGTLRHALGPYIRVNHELNEERTSQQLGSPFSQERIDALGDIHETLVVPFLKSLLETQPEKSDPQWALECICQTVKNGSPAYHYGVAAQDFYLETMLDLTAKVYDKDQIFTLNSMGPFLPFAKSCHHEAFVNRFIDYCQCLPEGTHKQNYLKWPEQIVTHHEKQPEAARPAFVGRYRALRPQS